MPSSGELGKTIEREELAPESGPTLHDDLTSGKHLSVPEPGDHSPAKIPPFPVPWPFLPEVAAGAWQFGQM